MTYGLRSLKAMGGKMGRFADINKYPEIVDLCEQIRSVDTLLHKVSKMLPYKAWDDANLSDDKWSVAAMRYAYTDYNPIIPCLRTPLVRTSGFSRLAPGAKIHAHSGYAGDIFRLHYGMVVPEGDCALQVGDEVRQWSVGEFMMFNDLDVHQAWNRTDETRIVLIVDVPKSSLQTIDPQDLREL